IRVRGQAGLGRGRTMIGNSRGTHRIQGRVRPRSFLGIAVGLVVVTGLTGALGAGEVKLSDRTFRVPDGFTIERIAGPPLVDRPITAAFDDVRRLYAADSSGSND